MMFESRNDIHDVWKGSQWQYLHQTQTKHTEDMDPDSSHVPCSVKDISDITSDDEHQHLYKDVMKAWMTANATGRSNIRHKLHESIDPLDASTHSDDNVVQIVSSRIATGPTVSVHEAVVIGTEMTKRCEST